MNIVARLIRLDGQTTIEEARPSPNGRRISDGLLVPLDWNQLVGLSRLYVNVETEQNNFNCPQQDIFIRGGQLSSGFWLLVSQPEES